MTRCHLSDLDVDQCACRVHVRGEDAEPHRRAFYGLPAVPARVPIRPVKPAPIVLAEPVSFGLLEAISDIERQIRQSAGEVVTLWPHLSDPISGAPTEPRVTGTGILADDDSRRSDDLPRIDSLVDLRCEISTTVAFWARLAIDERPVRDVSLSAHDVPACAAFLQDQATWLSGHAVGDECADDLRRLARTMHRVVVGTPHKQHLPSPVSLRVPVLLIPTAHLVRELPMYGYDISEGHIRVMLHRQEIASSGLDDSGDRLWDLWAVLYALGKRDTIRRTA